MRPLAAILAALAPLTWAVAATGAAYGGHVLTRAIPEELLRSGNGTLQGMVVRDSEDGLTHEVATPLVINATGAWVDQLRHRFGEPEFKRLVEPFDHEKYNLNMTVSENLLFGTAVEPAYNPAHFPSNIMVRSVLAETGLEERLFEMGKEVAATTVELFGDLSAGVVFPVPDFLDKFFTTKIMPGYTLFTQTALNHHLCGNTGVSVPGCQSAESPCMR